MLAKVADFSIADESYSDVLDRHVAWLAGGGQVVSYALHIGGLNMRSDPEYVDAFNSGDYAYADGMSVVVLARLSGASDVERTPTTDLGADLLIGAATVLDRRPRVATIGGTDELAKNVALAIERNYGAFVCYSHNGFNKFNHADFELLRQSKPDVVFVGMGMPTEAFFCRDNRAMLPNCLIMTCGGWFGFICGDEMRAPDLFQRVGMEWVYRLVQNPRRLARRYSEGAVAMVRLTIEIVGARLWRCLSR